jgi:predicted Zn-dependent peptidase
MSRLGASVLGNLPLLSLGQLIARVDAVGIDDLRELAAALFAPARLSVAGVGPEEERFSTAIEPLGDRQPAAALRGVA